MNQSGEQVRIVRMGHDLADFLENGLYDRAFVHYDPTSPTRMFQLSPPDFIYSVFRPDLAALDAKDGRPASGLAQDNDDPLSRRDMGLEFLDVTSRVHIALIDDGRRPVGHETRVYRITNIDASPIDTHLLVIADGLPDQVELTNASGRTSAGAPYIRVFLPDGVLDPGQSVDVTLRLRQQGQSLPLNFTLMLLSGQGNP